MNSAMTPQYRNQYHQQRVPQPNHGRRGQGEQFSLYILPNFRFRDSRGIHDACRSFRSNSGFRKKALEAED